MEKLTDFLFIAQVMILAAIVTVNFKYPG